MEKKELRLSDGSRFCASEPILMEAVGLPPWMMRDGVPIVPIRNPPQLSRRGWRRTKVLLRRAMRVVATMSNAVSRKIRRLETENATVMAAAESAAKVSTASTPDDSARAKLVEEHKRLSDLMKYLIVILDDKGGLGKSLMAQVAYEALGGKDRKILVVDADAKNKNMSRIGLSRAADALKVERLDFEGHLLDSAEQIELGLVDAVVIDSAAGSEEFFLKHLGGIAARLRSKGARMIIIRPITTNPLNQDNCVSFGREYMTDDMGVVMVRNRGQGRTEEDFNIWLNSPEHQEMLDLGMTEVVLEGAQVLWADVAAALDISLADIPRKKPEDLGLKGRSAKLHCNT